MNGGQWILHNKTLIKKTKQTNKQTKILYLLCFFFIDIKQQTTTTPHFFPTTITRIKRYKSLNYYMTSNSLHFLRQKFYIGIAKEKIINILTETLVNFDTPQQKQKRREKQKSYPRPTIEIHWKPRKYISTN